MTNEERLETRNKALKANDPATYVKTFTELTIKDVDSMKSHDPCVPKGDASCRGICCEACPLKDYKAKEWLLSGFKALELESSDFKVGGWVVGWHSDIKDRKTIAWEIGGFYTHDSLSPIGFKEHATGIENVRKATPEEIAKAKGEFVLPEKWCIKVYADGTPKCVNDWRQTSIYQLNWYRDGYLDKTGYHRHDSEGYEEITLDQFRKYVLKEPATDNKKFKVGENVVVSQITQIHVNTRVMSALKATVGLTFIVSDIVDNMYQLDNHICYKEEELENKRKYKALTKEDIDGLFIPPEQKVPISFDAIYQKKLKKQQTQIKSKLERIVPIITNL